MDPSSIVTVPERVGELVLPELVVASGGHPITFLTEHVFLVMPDQMWVMGKVNLGGIVFPVAFEAKLEIEIGNAAIVKARTRFNLSEAEPALFRHRRPRTALLCAALVFSHHCSAY